MFAFLPQLRRLSVRVSASWWAISTHAYVHGHWPWPCLKIQTLIQCNTDALSRGRVEASMQINQESPEYFIALYWALHRNAGCGRFQSEPQIHIYTHPLSIYSTLLWPNPANDLLDFGLHLLWMPPLTYIFISCVIHTSKKKSPLFINTSTTDWFPLNYPEATMEVTMETTVELSLLYKRRPMITFRSFLTLLPLDPTLWVGLQSLRGENPSPLIPSRNYYKTRDHFILTEVLSRGLKSSRCCAVQVGLSLLCGFWNHRACLHMH